MGSPGEASRMVLKHCADHWAELSEDERKRIKQERRGWLVDDLFGILLKVAMLALVAFMVWTVWRGMRGA